jgi:hypothetical protein
MSTTTAISSPSQLCSTTLPGNFALKLIALVLVLVPLLITAACGSSAQASGDPHVVALSGPLPAGVTGQPYNAVLNVSGGIAPYRFSVKSGSLPAGLTLNPSTGSIHGIPQAAGRNVFDVVVTDRRIGDEGTQTFAVRVISRGPSVNVIPASVTLAANQKQQFTANVTGTSNTGVTWSATVGSIDSNGLYIAPAPSSQTTVIVTAVSQADSSSRATATVTVEPANHQPPTITTTSLPQGQLGVSYQQSVTASGGIPPYTWRISSGNPPAGINLTSNGQLSGSPSATGTFTFIVSVTDSQNLSGQQTLPLTITSNGNYDGPAELPRINVASTMADTPAPGGHVQVAASADPQAAINSAQCGDTIQLQAGATYDKVLTLPAKPCDDQHWIVIRTNAPDSALPAEGQRLTPCYAGVASLPNRPAYPCSNPQNALAKVSHSVRTGSGPIIFASGANHYRLIGLEITRPADTVPVVALVAPTQDSPADHIVIDRCWIHGTTQDETRRGVALNGTSNVAIIDSYLNDFHCTAATGTCTDSQATGGGGGNYVSGPWKIEDNFLEAAAENILFGGSPATIVPTDITIRHNHFYKVPQWQKGTAGFVGGYSGNPFVVKNHFEIKNAARVLLEGNLFEYSWGGFTQFGHSILIAPRNDFDKQTQQGNLCAVCEATDITIRYNRISHVGAGFDIANVVVDGFSGQAGERYSIHDIVVDDINPIQYLGGGGLFLIMNFWPNQTLNNVSIRHVTGFPYPTKHMLSLTNNMSYPQMSGFTFSDNLIVVPSYPVWSAGGTNNCAESDVPMTVMSTCFKTYSFTNNVLSSVTKAFPSNKWPGGNMFPATVGDVQFVNYNNGSGGDYHLQSTSPYKSKASDGTDPGADIDAINAAVQGVE